MVEIVLESIFFEESMFEKKIPQYGGPESCNSVNMMRLTESLYQTDGRVDRIDYYERVLYNHILANYDPEEGMCVYYTPMRPGHYKNIWNKVSFILVLYRYGI